jgi:hypothetical protein
MVRKPFRPSPERAIGAGGCAGSPARPPVPAPGRRRRLALAFLLAALPLPGLLVACKPKPPEAPVVQGPRRISALGRLEPETRILKV